MIPFFALMFFPLCMAYAAASDLVTMRIPNLLSIALLGGFIPFALTAGMDGWTIGLHLACALVVLAGGFALFAAGWIGGGDAKIAAAVAVWFGWSHLLEFLLLSSILGGALTLLIVLWRRWPVPARLNGAEWIARLHEPKQGVPYGIAFAAAALHLYPATPIWLRLLPP